MIRSYRDEQVSLMALCLGGFLVLAVLGGALLVLGRLSESQSSAQRGPGAEQQCCCLT